MTIPVYLNAEVEPLRIASVALVVEMLRDRLDDSIGLHWEACGNSVMFQPVIDGKRLTTRATPTAHDRSTLTDLAKWCNATAAALLRDVLEVAPCGRCQGAFPLSCPICGPENCKPAEAYGSGVFSKLESYGAQDVEITFGGIPLTGLASGEHLSIEYEPLVTPADQPSARVSTISKAIEGVHNVEFLDVEETPTGMVVWTVGGLESSVRAAIELTIPSGSYDLYHTAEA